MIRREHELCGDWFVKRSKQEDSLDLAGGDAALAKDYISMIDKLIITGGQKCVLKFYGEEITISDDYLLKRDLFELALIEEARA